MKNIDSPMGWLYNYNKNTSMSLKTWLYCRLFNDKSDLKH